MSIRKSKMMLPSTVMAIAMLGLAFVLILGLHEIYKKKLRELKNSKQELLRVAFLEYEKSQLTSILKKVFKNVDNQGVLIPEVKKEETIRLDSNIVNAFGSLKDKLQNASKLKNVQYEIHTSIESETDDSEPTQTKITNQILSHNLDSSETQDLLQTITKTINDSLNYDGIEIFYVQSNDEMGNDVLATASSSSSQFKLAVKMPNYVNFVVGKMWPEITAAIIVYIALLIAFLLIYRSLSHERRLTQTKNDFINNIGHELKTPVTTVGVALEAIHSFNASKDVSKTNEYLNIAEEQLQKLNTLIDKVLKLNELDNTDTTLNLESLNLLSVIEDVVNSKRLMIEKTGAKIEITIPEQLSINGDREKLFKVFDNLLDNALKYQSSTPQITIKASRQNNKINLSFSDNGIGIPSEFRKKVFEKFFRVPQGNLHLYKGHGLGLSYVASVIKQHQGSISIQTNKGKGSDFIIQIPMNYEND